MNVQKAIQRLGREKEQLDKSRVREFYAAPLEDNIFEWHFTLLGPADSPYAEGLYHGVLRFSNDYPFSPPDITFLTTSGRFEVGKSICSSVSSYHPELWQPRYDIALVLVALRAFMAQDDEEGIGALARQYVSADEKRRLAREARKFSCAVCGMKSAESLWHEEMEGHPPVGAEVEASVPQLPKRKKPEANERGDNDKKAKACADAGNNNSTSTSDNCNNATTGSSGGGEEEAAATPETTEDTAEKAEEKLLDIAERSVQTEERSEPVAPGVRLRLGQRLLINLSYSMLDNVIWVCSAICFAILVKKALWG